MFNKLAQSIAIRHIIKLAKPEELTTPLEQHEASIGRDSRNNLTKSNVDRNTQHLDRLAEGQVKGISYTSKGPAGDLPSVDTQQFDAYSKAQKANYDSNVRKDSEANMRKEQQDKLTRAVQSRQLYDMDKLKPARAGL